MLRRFPRGVIFADQKQDLVAGDVLFPSDEFEGKDFFEGTALVGWEVAHFIFGLLLLF